MGGAHPGEAIAVTVTATDNRTRPAGTSGNRLDRSAPAPLPAASTPARSGPLGVRAGQIVTLQVAVALVLATLGQNPLLIAGAALVGVALVLLSWIRLRRRWLFEWIGIGLRYSTRQRTLRSAAPPEALLDLVDPGATIIPAELAGDAAAIVSDAYGLTAVLELGDQVGMLTDTPQVLLSPASLLPAASPETPPTRIQLLIAGAPAPTLSAGGGTPATSYRQLTDGRLLGYERVLLAVRVLRADGWSEDDLVRALSSAVRKVSRRLKPVPSRVLGERAALGVLAELAHHDGVQPGRESWLGVQLGGLVQTTFRLRRWPDLRTETGRRLIPRLLALPATATTVSLSAGPWVGSGSEAVRVDLTVRLAATTAPALATAVQALRRLLAAEHAVARRLDGEQLDGVAATLPLGVLGAGPTATTPNTTMAASAVDALNLPIGLAGLMIGTNRHGSAVLARLFRAETTRAVLIGGVRAAQLIALRAMALGARIVVQTARPRVWEPFVRGASAPSSPIAVIPPGRPVGGPPGSQLQPLLVVVDVGPVAADTQPGPGWQASLVVRDELAPVDVDAVSRADLVVLQPLRPHEAQLAGLALGLGDSADWLTRIRADMVGVINRRVLRWALLSATPIEQQLIGSPARF
ncbi:type VII secretion protein EccE [Micromonospora sp. HM5-17]|uniref:type VII secretion protein EccE n=1 Tax=Micromonospora sp. HM5-17 TaxID=2487710 RepID=UPI000F46B576|nr:type VII secretion protein EccE [Micromonospora sp. HM5-17]